MPPFCSLRHGVDDASAADPRPSGSRIAAIGPEHLRAHPAASRAGQERDHVGNVFRPAEALERRKPAVDTGPGATALTVISRPRSSLASTRKPGNDLISATASSALPASPA